MSELEEKINGNFNNGLLSGLISASLLTFYYVASEVIDRPDLTYNEYSFFLDVQDVSLISSSLFIGLGCLFAYQVSKLERQNNRIKDLSGQ